MIEAFWYRRLCEAAILLGAVIGGFWVAHTFLDDPLLGSLAVSPGAAIVALICFAAGLIATIVQLHKTYRWLTHTVLFIASITALMAVDSTGHQTSPYIALWTLVGLFAALGGYQTLPFVAVFVGSYGVYLSQSAQNPIQWSTFVLSFITPLVVSYLIWSRRFQARDKSSQSVTDLAQELNQESSKSDIIINAIADGVIAIDQHGTVLRINPAAQRIIGWNEGDALKLDYRSVLKIIDKKDEIIVSDLDPVQQCLRSGESIVTNDLGIRTTSGKQLAASILVSPLGETNSGAIIVFRDTTAQQADEREQAEFISTASHEMRTPVAAIEGYIGLALNPQTAVIDDKARSFLGKAQESAQHLGRLFQDLLDISKIEDGRLVHNPSVTDIGGFVKTLLETFTHTAEEKGISLVYGPETNSTNIAPIYYSNIDRDHLREILSNLVSNAIKYSKEGTVTLDVTGTDERVQIAVTDTGIGIPAEDIPHLFQKFYRVDNSDTREIGGTGLGLYLSRRLVESMGGRLELQSTYGKGSTFTVDIPRMNKQDADAALNSKTNSASAPTIEPTPLQQPSATETIQTNPAPSVATQSQTPQSAPIQVATPPQAIATQPPPPSLSVPERPAAPPPPPQSV